MPRPIKATLSSISNGGAEQLFQKLLREVHANIKDPNTKPDAKRKITLTLTFAPGADRDLTGMVVDGKSTLAPPMAKGSQVFFGTERGEPVVTTNDLNQYDIDDEAEAAATPGVTPLGRRTAEG